MILRLKKINVKYTMEDITNRFHGLKIKKKRVHKKTVVPKKKVVPKKPKNLRPTRTRKTVNGMTQWSPRGLPPDMAHDFAKMSTSFGKKSERLVGLTPEEYTIATSTIPNAGNGAFANIYLPKGTVLGYYKGKRLTLAQYERLADDSYVWELSSPYGPVYVDGKNPKLSNWLRFLNDSRDRRINVEPYQSRGNIYYRTIKHIKPGEEMFISYGDYYWE